MANYIKLADGTIVEVGTAKEFTPAEWTAYVADLQSRVAALQERIADVEASEPSPAELLSLQAAFEQYNDYVLSVEEKEVWAVQLEELQDKLSEVENING